MGCEPLVGLVVYIHRDPSVLQPFLDIIQPEADDLENRCGRELVEDEHRVEAVEELWREVLCGALEHLASGFLSEHTVLIRRRRVGEELGTNVTGQADNRVLSFIIRMLTGWDNRVHSDEP